MVAHLAEGIASQQGHLFPICELAVVARAAQCDSWAVDPDWFTCRPSTVPSLREFVGCGASPQTGFRVSQNVVEFRLTASGPVSSSRNSTRLGYTCATHAPHWRRSMAAEAGSGDRTGTLPSGNHSVTRSECGDSAKT